MAEARDLGTRGPVFEIAEENMLTAIMTKLKQMEESGALRGHQEKIAAAAKKGIERPRAVAGLSKGQHYRSWTFDPTITVQKDIADHKGHIISKAGTKVNPLDSLSFRDPLLLIDGDDIDQVSWAKQQGKAAWVLTKGSPFDHMKSEDKLVFFDQGGAICKKFNIAHLPAKISQEDKHLLVETFAVGSETGEVTS